MATTTAHPALRGDWTVTTEDGFVLLVNLDEAAARSAVDPASDLPAYRTAVARPMTAAERAADSRRPEYDPAVSEALSAATNAWCEAKALRRSAAELGADAATLAALDALVAAKRSGLDAITGLGATPAGPEADSRDDEPRCTCGGSLGYVATIAAPGYGQSWACRSCEKPWLKLRGSFIEPGPGVGELTEADVI